MVFRKVGSLKIQKKKKKKKKKKKEKLTAKFIVLKLLNTASYSRNNSMRLRSYVCVFEQKSARRKARAKTSPSELSSLDLSCSICNTQFRAKIGLISHRRTHK